MTGKMTLWDAVSKTDPAHTKKVNQRGGFTAISAHYQIMQATKQFGPVGEGWGYEVGEPMFQETLVFVPVRLWHGSRENTFGPVFGGAEWKANSRLDSDAVKKATTDGLTKALSQLGFNADVFLGRFDDNKYVAEVAREFAAESASEATGGTKSARTKSEPLTGVMKTRAEARTKYGEIVREMFACSDDGALEGYLSTIKAELAQFEMELPEAWNGDGSDTFPGLRREIDMARIRCSDGQELVDRMRAG